MKKFLSLKYLAVLLVVLFAISTAFGQGDETTDFNQSIINEILDAEETLEIIAAADTEYIQDWTDEEGFAVCHSDGPAPLIGISRERLVEMLGEPDIINDDGTEEWSIGKLHEIEMNPAPVLIFTFDEEGTVTSYDQLIGM